MPRTSTSSSTTTRPFSPAGTSKGSSGGFQAQVKAPSAASGQSVGGSPQEELSLIQSVKNGDNAAAEVLLVRHRGLIGLYVNKALPRARGLLERADLEQEAALALLHAAKKFDPQRGVRFTTYLGWWLFQATNRAIDTQASLIRVPHGAKARGVVAPVVGSLDYETTEHGDVLADVLAGPDDTEAEVLGQVAAEETLARLEPAEQRLVLAMAAGFSALEVAAMDGCDYKVLLRQRRRLRTRIV